MTVPGELRLVDDVAGAFSAAVVAAFQNRSGDPFSIALSGGQTARACYERGSLFNALDRAPALAPHVHPNYYAAYLRDPDGRLIEFTCHEAE